ncbi:MAG: STAS domain-containing protein [Leptospirales bacterium]|nr:STAS domain-containing protein [Leptospirales bacterium]
MDSVIEVEDQGRVALVHLQLPHIDMFNVTELLEAFQPVFNKKPPFIILDMNQTQFIDSSGMGGLIRIHQEVKSYTGVFMVAGLTPKVNNLLRLTRSNQYLRCFDTVAMALEAAR